MHETTVECGRPPNPLTLNDVLCAYDATDGKLHGHMNWFPATVTGRVVWEDHTDWTHKGDDDYNFSLFPSSGGLLTSTHPDHIEVEFDSDETIDAFGSSWWNSFHSAVDQGGPARIRRADEWSATRGRSSPG